MNTARPLIHLVLGLALLTAVSACSSGGGAQITANPNMEPDRYLFEQGKKALDEHHWLTAREYFQTIVDTYPTSPYREDAKLGIGDSYLGEGRIESDILAASEFREFLRFFPLAERADYAQYRLAISQMRQMLRPERDQTATRDALREFDTFVTNYPDSQYLPEVLELQRQVRDRLSQSELLVGKFYYRVGIYPGAVSRLEDLLKADPQFTNRDAVYYYLAESYYHENKKAEALPLYQKLVEEFAVSEFLDDARERLQELSQTPLTATATTTEGSGD